MDYVTIYAADGSPVSNCLLASVRVADIALAEKTGGFRTFVIRADAVDTHRIFAALMEQTLERNAILRGSSKLKEFVLSTLPQGFAEEHEERFTAYLAESERLDAEGYATFRMAEISCRVDFLLYRLVKSANIAGRYTF